MVDLEEMCAGVVCQYRPEWPSKAFGGIEAARDWVKRFATWSNG